MKRNVQGRPYIHGHGDGTMWQLIAAAIEQDGTVRNRELARRFLVSDSTVSRVRHALEVGKQQPEPTGKASMSYKQKMEERRILYKDMVDMLPGATLQTYQFSLPKSLKERFSVGHLCRQLKKYKLTRKSPLYVHPKKWEGNNPEYYERFLWWLIAQPLETRMRFKFFDEVRVDSRDLFKTKLRGEERRSITKSRMPDVEESYTINCLCKLDSEIPLAYDIVPGASNGERYISFWIHTGFYCLFPGDFVLVDNASFHAKGPAADFVFTFLQQLGVHYILIPKYSPELNPIELVFSLLKRRLGEIQTTGNLMEYLLTALEQIEPRHVLSFYKKRGYL